MTHTRFIILFAVLILSFSRMEGEQYPRRFEGFFEEYTSRRLDLIAKFLPDDPIIFEAGGHYGTDTIKFSKKWPRGTIVSFEPNPHAFEKLVEATKNNSNVLKYNLAVNDYNGTAILNVCYGTNGDNPVFEGASSLLEPSEWMEIHYQGPKVEVPCVILEDWCKENNCGHIDFMWLDLEGLELHILQSSPEILKTVRVIYTETNFMEFRKGMTQYNDLKKFLHDSGFILLAHWYAEGFQGNAIFVRNDLFYLGFKK